MSSSSSIAPHASSTASATPDKLSWFRDARYGLFIHWGPSAALGFGEQGMLRERIDQTEFEQAACRWNPQHFDAREWARIAVEGGFRYAVFTAVHHNGYCNWETALTDYSSVQQAPKRDFVREYVEAFREAGLRVGLYFSLGDFRVPAYWSDSTGDPPEWVDYRDYTHGRLRELLTNYGKIDLVWFDGAWPHNAEAWQSERLLEMCRELQPQIITNNRLDSDSVYGVADGAMENPGESATLGDFGTPEHHTTPDPNRPWESCQVSTSRLWGFAPGEHWRPTWDLLRNLCTCATQRGNLLLNVGPDSDGRIPPQFIERSNELGRWLAINGEAVYGPGGGDVTEFLARGYQTVRNNTLYLILCYQTDPPDVRVTGLKTRIQSARLLGSDRPLSVEQDGDMLWVRNVPAANEHDLPLFPVIALECDGPPEATDLAKQRIWSGDPVRYRPWAQARGNTPFVGK
ncbi:MAG: alpha-L-fucosidase [Planctomycetota bacterium]